MLQNLTSAPGKSSHLVTLAGSRSGSCSKSARRPNFSSAPPRRTREGRPHPRSIRLSRQCQHNSTQQAPEKSQSPTQQQTKLESLVSRKVDNAISNAVGHCLTETKLAIGQQTVGKVRDTYDCGSHIVIVTTDRQSAFDRLLASIPFKGQVLNQTSAWWMQRTAHIFPNALVSTPHPNVAVMRKCQVLPVEVVVRGFMTGSTDTSLWTHYNAGERTYCGNSFPDGMRKNDQLEQPVVTPTTKSATHDVPVSPQEIVEQGLLSRKDWDQVSSAALALFKFGQEQAAAQGLLLVDTKYEFGVDADGQILLIDEMHTPDSSRYWIQESYSSRHASRQEPESVDKEFLRLWFRERCDPYADKVLPEAPIDLVTELSRRYIYLYQEITGQKFKPLDLAHDPHEQMSQAVQAALTTLKG